MAYTTIAIHEDDGHPSQPGQKSRAMDHRVRLVSDDDDEAEYSTDVTDSEDEVDESVAEDMRKLEESFKGISQKYRLINRIGEGDTNSVAVWYCS